MKLNALLAVALAAVLGLGWLLAGEPTARNFEFLPQMVTPVPFESFSSNPIFADGKTLQPLPAHAVVRGALPLPYGPSPAEAVRAGRELANPLVAGDARDLARGAWVWATFCEVCHGRAGLGDGPVAQRGFPAPPSLLAPHALELADGQLFHIVTFGQNNMPPYAAQVERDDRWRVALYIRHLQATAGAAAPAATASTSTAATPSAALTPTSGPGATR